MKSTYRTLLETIYQEDSQRDRLSEIGSLLAAAIWRLQIKEREDFLQKSLDFNIEQSVTSSCNQL